MNTDRRLIPGSDIGQVLGKSRARGYQLIKEKGFPPPIVHAGVDGRTPLWALEDLEKWQREKDAAEIGAPDTD